MSKYAPRALSLFQIDRKNSTSFFLIYFFNSNFNKCINKLRYMTSQSCDILPLLKSKRFLSTTLCDRKMHCLSYISQAGLQLLSNTHLGSASQSIRLANPVQRVNSFIWVWSVVTCCCNDVNCTSNSTTLGQVGDVDVGGQVVGCGRARSAAARPINVPEKRWFER